MMKTSCLFGFLLLLLLPVFSFGANPSTVFPNGSGSDILLGGRGTLSITLPAPSGGNSGIDRGTRAVMPKGPANATGIGQGNTSTRAPDVSRGAVGFDREGHASILTPTPSGGYLGIDRQGNASVITPLGPGGDFGIDNRGNVWTITPGR